MYYKIGQKNTTVIKNYSRKGENPVEGSTFSRWRGKTNSEPVESLLPRGARKSTSMRAQGLQ